MKLAELLNERKSVKTEIRKLKERLHLAAKMQEGDNTPAESPDELKETLIGLYGRLSELIMRINRANMENLVEGETLMELIAARDKSLAIGELLHGLAEAATPKPERFSRNEIRYVSTVVVQNVRKEADTYAKAAREIDNKIQAANWSIEVA
ncbi:MAG: DIP1984 family protein [Nitrospirae bacterium]|nr:DIP1984 family protein [Nitrospirota bacterium]